ncbi:MULTISPECIES: orotate phosphoribosyltransferase [Aurantimonas]|uniref:orotate phosphoribosyltransferase n=1 Tax=Aurantimonas TaxID=182269 RepID=UPI001651D27E|nr:MULTISPECIES: orotate phosphoribosyltransferase [Aurantimonas]MCW7544380.1 orotate phosphoribosyltransferase [Aurantimonas litoralis]MBC6718164.1 orotate phosphoribosyltransferase [Aurantimonas sp. DM33-3]MCD1643109.1 orotate phosphoribosyltransferase [Aurantimonas coralicida]MDE0921925.1 orotate phosphoribosyltransferase [Aurantimonas coralicida]MDX1729712.1 orotate phosphoribosyltransferase [Aurantimonas coralicida]|tara:strand:- start:600 stop:1178 length:579 start_codon:yes stop_codon:yes gene_type:complete
MTSEEVLAIFREAGAYLEGHFILTSGLRSPVFLQKARVFMHPHLTERLCKALAERIREEVSPAPDYVVGPAIGGLIPAYETSRHLGAPAIWVERENGVFRLRRFEISPGDRVVIVEDIVTTGLSIRETVECLRGLGAEVLAAACIIDRSAGKVDVGVPLIALAEYEVPAYPADALPPELAAIPPVKPGSRNL